MAAVSAELNRGVRVAEGKDGDLIVLAAWCPGCAQEAMPNDRGECCWCGTAIVDEDALRASDVLEQLRASSSTPTPAPAPVKAARKLGRPVTWTAEKIVGWITAFAAAENRSPTSSDAKCPGAPTWASVRREFGTWGDALQAAGCAPTRRGRPRSRVEQPVADPGVSGSAEVTQVKERPPATSPLPEQAAPLETVAPDLTDVRHATLTAVNALFDLLAATRRCGSW